MSESVKPSLDFSQREEQMRILVGYVRSCDACLCVLHTMMYDRLMPVSSGSMTGSASTVGGAEAAKAGTGNLDVDASAKKKRVCMCTL